MFAQMQAIRECLFHIGGRVGKFLLPLSLRDSGRKNFPSSPAVALVPISHAEKSFPPFRLCGKGTFL